MAALVLTAAGAAIGGALMPAGFTILGATISGAAIGGAIGGTVGGVIDQMLFAPTIRNEGPRLSDLHLQASTEGAAIPKVYGRVRLGTQVIWATKFREVKSTQTQGGKGGGGGGSVTTTTYSYYASFALGLCEGEIASIGRVWADGKPLEIADYNIRVYNGTETQSPDPKIEAVEGTGDAPAFRGLAYLVFEELPLERFGNRVPQISVEVFRQPPASGPRLEDQLKSVTLIPGMGEFVYASDHIFKDYGLGQTETENKHNRQGAVDLTVALDQLEAQAPNIEAISLVAAWHGSDLRCGQCEIRPKVELNAKDTDPWHWRVSGLTRGDADVVSSDDRGPLLGGAPSDKAVVQAIQAIKQRGWRVVLYPFLMMDVPPGNDLPDPWTGETGQPPFPWRGRITCDPAPGRPGSPDKTPTAGAEVDAFFGSAQPAHFAWDGANHTVAYSGPAEWSFRRLVLHYARLAQAAGGVDAFLIGSEMIGLTAVRESATGYPAVARLMALAGDVRAILGSGTKIGYAADWSEYANHRPDDGSGDVIFNLDPLWADPNIDFVGIDNYMPLSDWRAGTQHLDAGDWPQIHDADYLKANIEGGEGFDWYYASAADRDAQIRTPIVDTAHGEHFVFRVKDVRAWWSSAHHDRPGGVRSGTPTQWAPQAKPVWFTELGCPAADKGTNQPNVFFDPKSAESALPYHSKGMRDDLIQRLYHEVMLAYWKANAPASSVYGGAMVEPATMFAWTWDARPYPDFPLRTSTWRDGPNWRLGHWLTGRLGLVTLADVVRDLTKDLGVPVNVSGLSGLVTGFVIERIMSARDALEPLMMAYAFDGFESEGVIRFRHRGGPAVLTLEPSDLMAPEDETRSSFTITRAQESELPGAVKLRAIDGDSDYQQAAVEAKRLKGESARVSETTIAVVMDRSQAQGIADTLLIDSHVMRERAEFACAPSALHLDPGDVVTLNANGRAFDLRLEAIGYEHVRPAKAVRTDASVYDRTTGPLETQEPAATSEAGKPLLEILDLPLLRGDEAPHAPLLAAYASPWNGVAVWRSPSASGFALDSIVENPATIGSLLAPFYPGPTSRWDRANEIIVELPTTETVESKDRLFVLGGTNLGAIKSPDGTWEIIQWQEAELVGPNQYRLSHLLRGQAGTEGAMGDPAPIGSTFVVVDRSLVQSSLAPSERGLAFTWKWGPATKPIDDPTVQSVAVSVAGIGLRPLSPVHLKANRDTATGDIHLTWIRRTRIGGDNWAAPDVPLGEEVETYEIDIHDGADVKRTLMTNAPVAVYIAAMQQTDFGGLVSALDWSVCQMSSAFGRGTKRRIVSQL